MATIFDLIEFLKTKKPETSLFSDTESLLVTKMNEIIGDLKIKRINFLKENIEELKHKIKQNYKRLRVPLFSLMEYDWNENSHSNILQYLLDHNTFKTGPEILAQMVTDSSKAEKNDLYKKILKRTYNVGRELAIPSGRIDLCIMDEREKFIIIIENKLLAEIGKTESDDENGIFVTQLEVYEKWSEEKYPNYDRKYVLLNFSNTESDTSSFDKVSYKQLYNNLRRFESDDNIFEDYTLLLNSLLNPLGYDLFQLKKLANRIIEGENPDISLTEYYTLKEIFYAA